LITDRFFPSIMIMEDSSTWLCITDGCKSVTNVLKDLIIRQYPLIFASNPLHSISARNSRFLPLKSASNSIYNLKKIRKLKQEKRLWLGFHIYGFPSSNLTSSHPFPLHLVCFPVIQTSKSQTFSLHLNWSSLVCCSTVLYLNRFPFKGLLMFSSH
jgi:hypothetical protein